MASIRLIAAIDDKRGLARGKQIPWRLPTDSAYYQDKTKGQAIALGKHTFELMGSAILAKRYSYIYVLSHQPVAVLNGEVVTSVPALIRESKDDLWVLGSGQVYAQFLPYADEIYLTRVKGDFGCDIFFPEFENTFHLASAKPWQTENNIEFRFEIWIPNPK